MPPKVVIGPKSFDPSQIHFPYIVIGFFVILLLIILFGSFYHDRAGGSRRCDPLRQVSGQDRAGAAF